MGCVVGCPNLPLPSPSYSSSFRQASGGSHRFPSARRRKNDDDTREGVPSGGGGGGGSVASPSTDEDSDHNMDDYSPNSDSSPASRPGYRLRKSLLSKRARNGGSEGESEGAGDWHGVSRAPLSEIVGVFAGGPSGRREGEAGHDPETYRLFVHLVERMLEQRPESR